MNLVQPAELQSRTASGRGLGIAYKLLVSLAIVVAILLVAGIWHLGANSMIACGFLGAWFIHMGSRPGLRQVGLSAGAGLAAAVFYKLVGGAFGPAAFAYAMGMGAFLGVGSLMVMALDPVWTGSARHTAALKDALILPVFSLIAGVCMEFANGGTHTSFDFLLYRFDASLGLAPGAAVASFFQRQAWIGTGASLVYGGLLIFPPLYHAWGTYRVKTARFHLMYAFVIAGVGGFFLYQICPAMGPVYAFGSLFPDHLPVMSGVPGEATLTTGVNNAMPSMHMTWALLVWVAAWELGPAAVLLASVFVGFTGLATLGSGEHYLIDLIVAAPLAMLVIGVCTRRYRWTAIGLGLVVGWTVYLRTGMVVPAALGWTAMIATVGATGFLLRPFLRLQPFLGDEGARTGQVDRGPNLGIPPIAGKGGPS